MDCLSKNQMAQYDEAKDIWALGITALCYAFNEDYSKYYDWTKKAIRKENIDRSIASLYENSLDPVIIDTIKMMLNPDGIARIDSLGIISRLDRKI